MHYFSHDLEEMTCLFQCRERDNDHQQTFRENKAFPLYSYQ